MKFELVTLHALAVDGRTFSPGQTIATLETQLDVSNIVSAAHFGDVKFVAIGSPQPPTPADTKRVRRDRTTETKTEALEDNLEPEVIEDLHPDVLNAQPDADTEPSSAPNGSGELDDTKAPEASTELPGEFRGLSERIATALCDAGFSDRQSVAKYYEENGGFAEIVGIGKAAERKIVAWLEG